MSKLSIQLYTLREESKVNFEEVLKFCSEQGFAGVEFAGFYDIAKETMKEWLDKYNLIATSAHTPMEQLVTNIQEVMDYNSYIGNKRIVIPYYQMNDEASTNQFIEELAPVIKTLLANGFECSYHNHHHELEQINGTYILDKLCEAFPNELKLQVDTFWVYAAGVDCVDFLETHKDKLAGIVHIKDGFNAKDCTEEQKKVLPQEAFDRMEHEVFFCPCAIGYGNAPVKQIVEKAKELGIEWLILENDFPAISGFEDVKKSMEVLKQYV